MNGWKSVLVFVATGYIALVALMYVVQRSLMYFPGTFRVAPADAGFPEAEEITLKTADGESVFAWHVPPRDARSVVIYFHGNGGSLRYRVDRFRSLTAEGDGLLALSYRGYGGSTGRPTEAGLIEDARAAYRFATSRYPADKLVLWGESLGSGVAIALAAEQPVARLVLEAPFASAMEIAAGAYPFAPVRWLMKDQFRSDLRIADVRAPVLVVHGDRDRVVPIGSGERLFALIQSPKRFIRIPGGGHENLGGFGIIEAVRKFVQEKFD
jgi:fermentation-respiration switch protein FrsA (DUF1100 family)